MKALPTLDRLHELFEIRDGHLIRRVTINHRAKAGDAAGTTHHSGYVQVCVDRRFYWAHRIVYAMTSGFDPGVSAIDHINNDRADNHPENLRLATPAQNSSNRSGAQSNSATQIRGVSWHASAQKWQVHVGKRYLGVFESISEAADVARHAQHELFGDFA